jgi:hypothetical protein
MAGAGDSESPAWDVDELKEKLININEKNTSHDHAIESLDDSMQLRSCPSDAPNGKKNVPVGIGGIPVGAGIEDASHIIAEALAEVTAVALEACQL